MTIFDALMILHERLYEFTEMVPKILYNYQEIYSFTASSLLLVISFPSD